MDDVLKTVKTGNFDRQIDNVTLFRQYVPLKNSIQKILQFSNNMEILLNNIKVINSSPSRLLSHYFHGSLGKKIQLKCPKKLVVPLNVYFDEFTVDNKLGPHKNVN